MIQSRSANRFGVPLIGVIFRRSVSASLVLLLLPILAGSGSAQTTNREFDSLLNAGEFSAAMEMARANPDQEQQRLMYQNMAAKQLSFGSGEMNAGLIRDFGLSDSGFQETGFANPESGAGGGITQNDFVPLMNLIQNTVDRESWVATGNGDGTMLPFVAGVHVDPSGTLKRTEVEELTGFDSFSEKPAEGRAGTGESRQGPREIISLVGLEQVVSSLLETGRAIPADVFYPAGLYTIEQVVVQPDTGDLLLAGRGGPWRFNAQGVAVNQATGRPLLRLDDLVVCLRMASSPDGKFGCSITPRKKNLQALQNFLATTRLTGDEWSRELRSTVGFQDVEYFGVDPSTHVARVLVDADHHMKLLGMGIEPGAGGVTSFFDETVAGFSGQPLPVDLARWWFTFGDISLRTDSTATIYEPRGNFVRVLSESELLDDSGERIHTGKSKTATRRFAADFTRNFSAIADRYPVYRELENIFRIAFVCQLIKDKRLDERIGWDQGCFAAGSSGSSAKIQYAPMHFQAPTRVASVINTKSIETRNGSKRLVHTIAGVSGGVECDPESRVAQSVVVSDPDVHDPRLTEAINRDLPLGMERRFWRTLQ